MYNVRLTSDAQEFYAGADLPLAKKIARCFEVLEVPATTQTSKHSREILRVIIDIALVIIG